MKGILGAVFSAAGILVIVALILSACLWIGGPLVAFGEARPFESLQGRLIALAVLWLLVLVVILILTLTARKRDEAIAEEITTQPAKAAGVLDDEYVQAELDEMRGKLKTAIRTLRGSKGGRKRLYDLPWYVIIGPPGAGKTTAIANSKLNFPLETEFGKEALKGVGGTRNCDWWFTDQAVLIDTAGRYTTQDSDAEADNAAWLGFLKMLKRQRPRQPVNGAIVAISLSDLSNQDEITRKAHAQAVRRRLHELRTQLGIRFPVYVLFTKADLVAGFAEFFDRMGKEGLAQVWGATLPLPKVRDKAPVWDQMGPEFDALVARLNEQVILRLQEEQDPARRSLIAAFPSQVASLRPVAEEFLSELFQENTYEHKQMLRGVYFTSGTQEGTPIDRLMMGMARTFGIGRQAIGSGRGTGLSYFLTRLFSDVIFPEAGLVSADDKVERRYRLTRAAAYGLAALTAIGLGTVWAQSYFGNKALTEEALTRIAAYRICLAGLPQPGASPATTTARDAAALQIATGAGCSRGVPSSPIADSGLLSVLPPLNLIAAMPGSDSGAPVPAGLGWGLYQGADLGNAARLSYRSALNQIFLPRLILRLEEEMQGNINEPDYLYDALKAYLMLGQAAPETDRAYLSGFLTAEWERSFPGASLEAERTALGTHLAALLNQPMDQLQLNDDLVGQVQGVLTELPLAQRVYNGIISSKEAEAIPAFRLTDIGGPKIGAVMVRPSGAKLNEGVPGIFTRRGFDEVFIPSAVNVAQQVQSESWVLGASAEEQTSEAALIALSRDVIDLYNTDYALAYDQLLGDIDIIPLNGLDKAVEVTQILSGPSSPMANVLNAISTETRLAEAAPDSGSQAALPPAAGNLAKAAGATATRVAAASSLLGRDSRIFLEEVQKSRPPGPDGKPPAPGAFVQTHFQWLHDLTAAKDGQPSQLDGLVDTLAQVSSDLSRLSFAGGVSDLGQQSTALLQFREAASRLEGPMKRWASQIAVGSTGVTVGGTRAALNAKWQSDILPVCSQVTGNTYPFQRRARTDAPLQDFGRLFGPGGLIDGFFNETLAKFVDQTKAVWTWKTVNGGDLGISDAVLAQFQQAAQIRDTFFAGAPQPKIGFQVTPYSLDPNADSVSWEIDGQKIAFDGKSARPAAIAWPGSVGLSQVTLQQPKGNSENDLTRDGPWALFRLLDAAQMRRTAAADRVLVTFTIGGRIAQFEIQAGSLSNPFTTPALGKFKCPQSF